jgi:hypothetical protein
MDEAQLEDRLVVAVPPGRPPKDPSCGTNGVRPYAFIHALFLLASSFSHAPR